MAVTSKLHLYSFSAYVKRDRDRPLKLDDLNLGGGGDFLDGFDKTVSVGAEWPPGPDLDLGHEDMRDRVIRVTDVRTPDDDARVRYGRMAVDQRTFRYDLNMRTGERVKVGEWDREGRPVFFWLGSPEGSETALLITERRARFGIVGAFWRDMVLKRMREFYPDATFDLSAYQPVPIWEAYQAEGEGVEGLELRRVLHEVREDREDESAARRESIGKLVVAVDLERKIRPSKADVAKVLKSGDRRQAWEIVLKDSDFDMEDADNFDPEDFETCLMDVKLPGGSRKVAIGSSGHFRQFGHPVRGVPDDEDGFPDLDRMAEFARTLAQDTGYALGHD